jgi:hypothetical protein
LIANRLASLLLGTGLLWAGCAGTGLPAVVTPPEVDSTEGLPQIEAVRDLGRARIPAKGPWVESGHDGHAMPGEVLLIRGRNFGLSPSVLIGDRPTQVLGRTRGGHIIVRVPPSVAVGHPNLSVQNGLGKATFGYPVRRAAVMVHDDATETFLVDREKVDRFGKTLHTPGAERVRISADGALAYVLTHHKEQTNIEVIDLVSGHEPSLLAHLPLQHRATLLAAALNAPVSAALGEGKVTLLKEDTPPAAPFELPPELQRPRAIDISPDGKLLALLMPDQNRVVLWSFEQGTAVASLNLLPDAQLPLVRDLAFAVDGESLWVVSGTSERTLPIVEPTRLTCVRIKDDKTRTLSVWKTQSVPGASAPLRIAVARGQPVASGSIVRIPPEKAAVFITTVNDAMFRLSSISVGEGDGVKQAMRLWNPPQPGQVARGDISGGGGPLFMTAQVLSSLDVTPDAQLILAVAAQLTPSPKKGEASIDFGLTITPAWGSRQLKFLPLGTLKPSLLRPPFHFGEVRIQP